MAIPQATIRRASAKASTTRLMSLSEGTLRQQTAFLCHSHKDKDLVAGVAVLLKESGWDLYIDWTDSSMPETPDRETATKIKQRIDGMRHFLFLATQNSMTSRWCPWEIGFADSKKGPENVLVIPTSDEGGRFYGNEYLQLYPRIDMNGLSGLAMWRPGNPAHRSLGLL